MSWIKADNPDEQEIFNYLEKLRQSGKTNMFGAGRYLQQRFSLERKEANEVLGLWMKLHNDPERVLESKPKD